MTTYSRSELATRALKKAGIVGLESNPTAAELADAEELISSDTEALEDEGIPMVNGSDQAVPSNQFEPRAAYHAITLKEDYGLISEADAEALRDKHKKRLRRLSALPATGSVVETEYF